MAESTPELKTYYGNCHCAAFKFHIKVPEITSLMVCNCSICSRQGYKWVFPGKGGFVIEKGDGTLKTYEFGPKKMGHQVIAALTKLFEVQLMQVEVLPIMWNWSLSKTPWRTSWTRHGY